MKLRLRSVIAYGSLAIVLWIAAAGEAFAADRARAAVEPTCGDTWTAANPFPPIIAVGPVIWTGTQLVGIGSNIFTAQDVLLTSADGLAWNQEPLTTTASIWAMTWDGAKFVGVGPGGTIATSPDGAEWTAQTSGTSSSLLAVTSTGSLLVAVGDTGTIVTSSDGITWSVEQIPNQGVLESVVWTGSQIVVGGYMGAVYTSPDGVNWTQRTWGNWSFDNVTVDLWSMVWTGQQLVAVGSRESDGADIVITSPDGITWTKQAPGTSSGLRAVTWAGTEIVAVGGGGTILASGDGVTWTPLSSGTFADLLSVVWTGARLVAVAGSTTILTSPCEVPACTAPEIAVQPTGVGVLPGHAGTLNVEATGTGPLTYQWYQGTSGDTSVPVGTGGEAFSTVPLAGAASFWVRVSNACGHADSEAAIIEVARTVHRRLRPAA